MYIEHYALTHEPFPKSNNPDIFFTESRTWQVYQSLVVDILAGKSLLKLVGPEGSGKSQLLCMLVHRLPASQQVILLDPSAGSFAALLHHICTSLGVSLENSPRTEEAVAAIRDSVNKLRQQEKRVVLLMDAVEQLSAEVVSALVDFVKEGGGNAGVSLVLSGRQGLDTTLEQLADQGEEPVFAENYTLEPLTESETRQYLRFCASEAGMSRADYAEVFTDRVVTKIFKSGQGNLRLINILAEEVLQNVCAEKSFMVLLDQVDPETTETSPLPPNRCARTAALFRSSPLLGGGFIAFVVFALVLGSMFLRTQDAPVTPPETMTASSVLEPQVGATDTPATPPRHSNIEKGKALLQDRTAASARWLSGELQEKYTIQLMMLSSSSAEYSLASTLASDDYAPVLDLVYVLSNQETPPSIFVYYGVYDTLDAAREARNTMPLFLQQQGPYPLAIADAVEKVKTE
nr:AAA family ATPase [Desulfobulbus rhabdoformis]